MTGVSRPASADNLSRTVGERDAARDTIAAEKQRADDQERRTINAVAVAANLEERARERQRARDEAAHDRAAHAEQLRALDRQLGETSEDAHREQGGLIPELRGALVQALALADEVDVEDLPRRIAELPGAVGRLLGGHAIDQDEEAGRDQIRFTGPDANQDER